MSNLLRKRIDAIQSQYPLLTRENIGRILILDSGINYKKQHSFPDHFSHYELILTIPTLSNLSILTLLNPKSDFELIDTGVSGEHVLLYKGEFVDSITDYEQRLFDFKNKQEPFYFYVEEINGDLVLKLNPIQLCDFFQSSKGEMPCQFCFRNDMVQRFRNISASELVSLILKQEAAHDSLKTLQSIDELSIITGSYKNNSEYVEEMVTLISGLKPHIRESLRVVVGSHEGKPLPILKQLHKAGVTTFAFPIESLDDTIRKTKMKNRKGIIPMSDMVSSIKGAHALFGDDGIIIRLVAGMGDALDETFIQHVQQLSELGEAGPHWNINVYMPFTHYHWKLFQTKKPYTLEYIFEYQSIINTYVPQDRQMRFKISP